MPPHLLLILSLLMLGCGHGKAEERPPAEPSFVRGDVSRSGSRKASLERPQPWDEEKRRFPEDGLNLEGYQQKVRDEHAASHDRSSLSIESFSHPACSALRGEDRAVCPLLRARWSNYKEVEGGASVEVSAEQRLVRKLRLMVLCHVAFGKASGHKRGCPLHLPKVRTAVRWADGKATLLITTGEEGAVDELRNRLENLVP